MSTPCSASHVETEAARCVDRRRLVAAEPVLSVWPSTRMARDLLVVGDDLGHVGEQLVRVREDDCAARLEVDLLGDLDLAVLEASARAAVLLRIFVGRAGLVRAGVDVVVDAVAVGVGRAAVLLRVVALHARLVGAGVDVVRDAVAVTVERTAVLRRIGVGDAPARRGRHRRCRRCRPRPCPSGSHWSSGRRS